MKVINYTYLWDIICTPNTNLFSQGINLVILEMPNDDPTDNIKIISIDEDKLSDIKEARIGIELWRYFLYGMPNWNR